MARRRAPTWTPTISHKAHRIAVGTHRHGDAVFTALDFERSNSRHVVVLSKSERPRVGVKVDGDHVAVGRRRPSPPCRYLVAHRLAGVAVHTAETLRMSAAATNTWKPVRWCKTQQN